MSQTASRALSGAPVFAAAALATVATVAIVATVATVAAVVLSAPASAAPPAAKPAAPATATAAAAPASPGPSPALKGYKPCSLLTADEVGKALGAPPAAPKETDTPYGKDGKGQDHEGVLSTCSWGAGPRTLLLAVSRDATTKEGKERGIAARKKSEAELEKRGMKIERKSFGKTECTVLTPAADVKAPLGVSCRGEKGKLVWFASISSKKEAGPVPVETLKGITDKAASRLP